MTFNTLTIIIWKSFFNAIDKIVAIFVFLISSFNHPQHRLNCRILFPSGIEPCLFLNRICRFYNITDIKLAQFFAKLPRRCSCFIGKLLQCFFCLLQLSGFRSNKPVQQPKRSQTLLPIKRVKYYFILTFIFCCSINKIQFPALI